MASVRENLIAARALIDTPEKWGKGEYEPRPGCYCALGAIAKVSGHDPSSPWFGLPGQLLMALEDQLPSDWLLVPDYNDDPSTTYTGIMKLFDRAIAAQVEE